MITKEITKKLLQEARGKNYTGKEIVLYLSKDVFKFTDLKPIDLRLLIVLSSIKDITVETMKHYRNPLLSWITRKEQSKSSKLLNKSLIRLAERDLIKENGTGLVMRKDYIIFKEKEFPLLNIFNSTSQLFMISARVWNRNEENQIVPYNRLDNFLPSSRRTEYFKVLIKALRLNKKTYGYFLDGNTFKKNLDGMTKNEKMVTLAHHKGYEKKGVVNCMEDSKKALKEVCEQSVEPKKAVDNIVNSLEEDDKTESQKCNEKIGEFIDNNFQSEEDYDAMLERNRQLNKKKHEELFNSNDKSKNVFNTLMNDKKVTDDDFEFPCGDLDEDTDFPC